jgi:hypothetical protein
MRRIYESDALYRDDEEPHAPRERDRESKPQAMRSVPSGFLSKLLVPHRLRYWAIDVDVRTPDRTFRQGERVPFTVVLHNRLPIPLTLPVASPVPWIWSIDGFRSASRVGDRVPEEPSGYHFDRGERKEFTRRWSGSFKVGAREWELATPGEHTIRVGLNVSEPVPSGLVADTTIVIDS